MADGKPASGSERADARSAWAHALRRHADGEVTPYEFLALAMRALPVETKSTTIARTLGYVRDAY